MIIINHFKSSSQVIVIIIFLSLVKLASAEHHEFEEAADLLAADFLAADLLKGAHHEVEDRVRSDGYLNYYRINSDYGEFEAISSAMLGVRVGEINALGELDDLSKTEVFVKAAADAGVGQIKALTQFATHPINTIVGIPSGIGRMFKRYTRQAGEVVDATAEFVAGDDAENGDDGEDNESTTDKAVDVTESVFGVSGAERAWAQKLGTDPYSSNETLRAAIKEVAWAERLGRIGMGFAAIPEIPGADIIGDVNDAVWSKDPYELQDLNRARLAAISDDESLIEEYIQNPRMTPSQQTLLTAAIAEIKDAEGRAGILRQALNAETEAEANFLIKSVTMLSWYHINKKPIAVVQTYAAVPVGITEEGTVVLTFAVDHVYWTDVIAAAAKSHATTAMREKNAAGEVWLLGTASERVREELTGLGFAVHEQVASMMVISSN